LDANGNPTHVYNSNGTESQATWGCCGKEWEKDENGVEYSYTYDALKRLIQKVKSGTATQADQYTTYTYDVEDRLLTETTSASGLSQGRTNQYDMAGRLTNSTDLAGLETRTTYSQDGLTTTETLPGGYTRITERHKDGQVKSITGTAQISQYYEYGVNEDGTKWAKVYSASLGRKTGATDPRLGTATTHYDSHGWVDYVEDAGGRRTSFTYGSSTGRKASQTDPLTNVTYYSYLTSGQLEKTWGSAAYPVLYEYDGYGRMVKMSTYRGGTGWSSSTWPASPGTADTTEWVYHEASGLPTSKKDAAGKSVAYTYSSGGKLDSRTWSRTNGTNSLITSYSYNSAGDLSAIDYSDSTPDVSFAYDRLGRQKTADSSVSAHTFAYNGLLLDTETIVSFAGTNVIDRSYDGYGRSTGFALDSDYSIAYGYDDLGRLNQISNTQFQASYSYLANSDLISTIANGDIQTTRTYEQNRNLLTQVKNEVDSVAVSQFDYANDNGGRRTSIKYSGTAFDTGASFNQYQYNNRGEVLVADRFWGANINDTSDPVTGQGFAYAYDNIGNRTGASRDNEETAYTANNLNQYSQRTVADLIDVIGSAETNTTVTVNDLATTRHGKYWHKGLGVTNDSSAVYQSVNVVGVYNPPGTNDPDIVTSVTGHVFVAKTPEQFVYDNDGNLTSDGRFSYVFDSENRLIGAETLTNLPSSVSRVKVEFTYDYMSRRVSKTVYNWVSNDWSLVENRGFVYDSWNLIREIAVTPTPPYSVTNSYVYGLDLSGSLQGAGGIGGLLATIRPNPTNSLPPTAYLYSYDANGNVSELTDAGNGSVKAHYEYSAYGEVLVSTGDLAADNHFQFSTKYLDSEVDMNYYGYRFYSPSLGRFLSRDPIGEIAFKLTSNANKYGIKKKASINLYRFVLNNPVNNYDIVGLLCFTLQWDNWSSWDYQEPFAITGTTEYGSPYITEDHGNTYSCQRYQFTGMAEVHRQYIDKETTYCDCIPPSSTYSLGDDIVIDTIFDTWIESICDMIIGSG